MRALRNRDRCAGDRNVHNVWTERNLSTDKCRKAAKELTCTARTDAKLGAPRCNRAPGVCAVLGVDEVTPRSYAQRSAKHLHVQRARPFAVLQPRHFLLVKVQMGHEASPCGCHLGLQALSTGPCSKSTNARASKKTDTRLRVGGK
jgi:hypothetical protein